MLSQVTNSTQTTTISEGLHLLGEAKISQYINTIPLTPNQDPSN